VALGRPDQGYPFTWAVHEWLPGEPANAGLRDPHQAAVDLAQFITALRAVDSTGAPSRAPGTRGGPLTERNEDVHHAIVELGDRVDGAAALRSWKQSLTASVWDSDEVWVHGDLPPGNLLLLDGQLSAVIDFGGLNIGDPACDLQPAWNPFAGDSRLRFLAELKADEATRLRGRGWALSQALIALPYYWQTNPGIVSQALHALDLVLDEDGG
jgi:aminoglycoside phosphotransferase (APT) family kinase protein